MRWWRNGMEAHELCTKAKDEKKTLTNRKDNENEGIKIQSRKKNTKNNSKNNTISSSLSTLWKALYEKQLIFILDGNGKNWAFKHGTTRMEKTYLKFALSSDNTLTYTIGKWSGISAWITLNTIHLLYNIFNVSVTDEHVGHCLPTAFFPCAMQCIPHTTHRSISQFPILFSVVVFF